MGLERGNKSTCPFSGAEKRHPGTSSPSTYDLPSAPALEPELLSCGEQEIQEGKIHFCSSQGGLHAGGDKQAGEYSAV